MNPAVMMLLNLLKGPTDAVSTVAGLEYTLPANRLHFTMAENLLNHTMAENRLHYTMPDDD